MRNSFVHGVGGVLSGDIAVPEHGRELAFYSNVLTTGDAPLWRDDLMNNLGTPIIGLGERIPEYEALPLQWMPHIQVADVAASAAAAVEMGGKELMHGKDADGQSQWAVLVDPDGAGFGIVQEVPAEPGDTGQNERSGRISWLSLTVPDALSSRDFYQKVVGWNARPVETGDSEENSAMFEMLIDDDTAAAEIRQSRGEQDSIPPVWLFHLPVGDLAESLRQVSKGGGEVIRENPDENYAVIRDPVGVYLALGSA